MRGVKENKSKLTRRYLMFIVIIALFTLSVSVNISVSSTSELSNAMGVQNHSALNPFLNVKKSFDLGSVCGNCFSL